MIGRERGKVLVNPSVALTGSGGPRRKCQAGETITYAKLGK